MANIYLNEFDRFVLQQLKPLGYVRYGDDFIVWGKDQATVTDYWQRGGQFLEQKLKLTLHSTNHALQPSKRKLHYLGIEFWPTGHRLDKRMRSRINDRLRPENMASYQALLKHHCSEQTQKKFAWECFARELI